MSSERLTLFQETLQTTCGWVRELAESLEIGDRRAYALLCATLWALRDRLLPDQAVALAAQLPVLLRGAFYEGWRIVDVPLRVRDRGEFLRIVAARYRARPTGDLEAGVRAVLRVLSHNIDFGETFALLRAVPDELRDLWPEHMVRELDGDAERPPLH